MLEQLSRERPIPSPIGLLSYLDFVLHSTLLRGLRRKQQERLIHEGDWTGKQ